VVGEKITSLNLSDRGLFQQLAAAMDLKCLDFLANVPAKGDRGILAGSFCVADAILQKWKSCCRVF
jgi:hypothetical protein